MKKLYLFLCGLIVMSVVCAKNVVIFDLGGVLTHACAWRSIKYAYKKVGVRGFVRYLFDGHNPFRIKKQIFTLLNDFDVYRGVSERNTVACYGSSVMPQIVCDWLAGSYAGPAIIRDVLAWIDGTHCCSSSQRRIFKEVLFGAFDPQTRGALITYIPAGLDIVRFCKELGCRLMILSNIDQETFDLLYTNPDMAVLFDLFDDKDIFISASMKKIKPHANIFETLLYDKNLDPADCIFIDDQPENVDTAHKLGMRGIVCSSHKKVKEKLQELLLVPYKELNQ